MHRRHFLTAAVAALVLPPHIAGGQDAWPQRTITIIVPFLAGGSALGAARSKHTDSDG
jgi:tripartite-type tricarboxylate transporter receptor subunit TctC